MVPDIEDSAEVAEAGAMPGADETGITLFAAPVKTVTTAEERRGDEVSARPAGASAVGRRFATLVISRQK